MLNSVAGQWRSNAASSPTSGARTWRPSGRGCTVMPSAPASSAIRARCSTLGMPIVRVLRRSATLLRLTLSEVMVRKIGQQRSKLTQIVQDAARVQRLAVEMVANQMAQNELRVVRHHWRRKIAARNCKRGAATQARRVIAGISLRDTYQATLGVDAIDCIRFERRTVGTLIERGCMPGFAQKFQF